LDGFICLNRGLNLFEPRFWNLSKNNSPESISLFMLFFLWEDLLAASISKSESMYVMVLHRIFAFNFILFIEPIWFSD
jgi:hypothetical protein